MRVSLLIGTTLLALSTVAVAQTKAPPPAPMQATTTTMPTNPQAPAMPPLTAEQKDQVQVIMLDEAKRTRERLAKVLTPEQMAALDARVQAHLAQQPGGAAQP